MKLLLNSLILVLFALTNQAMAYGYGDDYGDAYEEPAHYVEPAYDEGFEEPMYDDRGHGGMHDQAPRSRIPRSQVKEFDDRDAYEHYEGFEPEPYMGDHHDTYQDPYDDHGYEGHHDSAEDYGEYYY